MAGPGKNQILDQETNALTSLLYNFDIAQHQLKPEHEEWLKYNVTGYLKRGGGIALVGLASRTATDDFNKRLSQRRIDSVIDFLRRESPNNFAVRFQVAMGEGLAEQAGAPDNSEDEKWRGVLIAVSARPTPPPPPKPLPPAALPPPIVERRVYAEFLYMYTQSGGTYGDPRNAKSIADAIARRQFAKSGGQLTVDKKTKVPASHVVRQIFVYYDVQSSNFAFAKTTMIGCQVDYEWGRRRNAYCILVDYIDRIIGGRDHDPSIALLTDAQADRFVNNPFAALHEKQDMNLRIVDYKNYSTYQ
jgi:hypothetical protein